LRYRSPQVASAGYLHADALGEALRPYALGGLVSAGAFGGAHATPRALGNALVLLPPGTPVAFTIDEQGLAAHWPRKQISRLPLPGVLRGDVTLQCGVSRLRVDISAPSWREPVVRMVLAGSSLSRRRIVPVGAVAT
jgi:hypothetical protein